MTSTTKVKVDTNHSYNKTVVFNFGRHKDLSTLKGYTQLGFEASVNITFSGR